MTGIVAHTYPEWWLKLTGQAAHWSTDYSPRNRDEVKTITWRQFDWLMSGLEIEQPKAIKSA